MIFSLKYRNKNEFVVSLTPNLVSDNMIAFKEFFSFRHNRFFWINLVLMAVVIVAVPLIALLWLNGYTRHGEAVSVPEVKGMSLGEAKSTFARRSLKAAVVDSSYVKGTAPGVVLEQSPVAGARVKEGRTIYLTINASSAPEVPIPDIMDNSSLRQAEAKLRALGFKVTEPEYISGERDWVYGVKYRGRELRAGEKVPAETVLTLCVGNGNEELPEDSIQTDMAPIIDESWF